MEARLLLYGPPGTGKSSLVAAMANYLKFDVYDLDLKEVQCNSDLRRLLIGTGNRSVLVIKDIDCSIGLQNRNSEDEYNSIQDEKVMISCSICAKVEIENVILSPIMVKPSITDYSFWSVELH